MKKEMRKKLWKILLFLVKFNLLAVPMYLVIYFNLSYFPLQSFLAFASYKTLSSLGYHVAVEGNSLFVSNYIIQVSWDSTGWKSLYALTALTLATPALFKGKIKFLAIALPSIFLINFLRIVTTILVALNFGFEHFEVVHTLLWREGLIFIVVALWYLWFKKQN